MISRETIKYTVNRYKNSIFFVDSLLKDLVADLKAKGVYDNTMLIITGDHGEEFYEAGYFGHHGAFTEYQTKVPLLIKYPKNSPHYNATGQTIEQTRLSSHQDIIPTIFDELGSTEEISKYSNGFPLTKETEKDFVVACSFYDCSIIYDEGHIIFGIEAHTMMRFVVRDEKYKRIEDMKPVVKRNTGKIVKAIKETGMFLK